MGEFSRGAGPDDLWQVLRDEAMRVNFVKRQRMEIDCKKHTTVPVRAKNTEHSNISIPEYSTNKTSKKRTIDYNITTGRHRTRRLQQTSKTFAACDRMSSLIHKLNANYSRAHTYAQLVVRCDGFFRGLATALGQDCTSQI